MQKIQGMCRQQGLIRVITESSQTVLIRPAEMSAIV